MLLDLLVYVFNAILLLAGCVITVGLYWKMQVWNRPILANGWWLMTFLPLAFMTLVVVFDQSGQFADRVMMLSLVSGLVSIRFFNPLDRGQDGNLEPDDGISG